MGTKSQIGGYALSSHHPELLALNPIDRGGVRVGGISGLMLGGDGGSEADEGARLCAMRGGCMR